MLLSQGTLVSRSSDVRLNAQAPNERSGKRTMNDPRECSDPPERMSALIR